MKLEQLKERIHTEGISKQQIYSNEKFETLLVAVKAGTLIPTQPSPADAGLYLIEGRLVMEIDGIKDEICTDDFFSFEKGQMHSLEAMEDSKFIISRCLI
ncbi:MAG: cupin domain-containing protein [Marinifilaceae bacterium]|jgi:quercetin dioxygenase-like cupin family protein